MNEDSTVIRLRQPEEIDDPLTAVLRSGARRLLAQAIEAEAEVFLGLMADRRLDGGRARFVRHGRGPERAVQTGIGPVAVQRVKVRDRGAAEDGERVRFSSAILPRWCRRTRSIDALLPILYLRGISTGDFQEALAALLGKDAPNLSPSVIARLKGEWQADYERWQKRDLAARRYVYIWADGVYLQARLEPQAECMLVIIGATPEGKKELVGFQVGTRESAQSWRELLVGLKARGLAIAPELAIGDGALGFWKALEEDADAEVRDVIKLLLFTGQRRGNVLTMRWADIDLSAGVWSLSAKQTKQAKAQTTPLVAQAREILQARFESASTGWVFPAVRRSADGEVGPMSETRLRDAWARICGAAGIEDLRPHDLRHTSGSWLARLGASEAVRQKALGHSTPAMSARYAHLELDPVADALQRVANAVEAEATKPAAKVRKFKKGAA